MLFTKPAMPGRVKTRLIGHLTAEQAAELHAAFIDDVLAELAAGDFDRRIAWALAEGEEPPRRQPPPLRQSGDDLGERLYRALAAMAASHRYVAALGSDHPTVRRAEIEAAFRHLETGADLVLGPAEDGGYFLIALCAAAVRPELFAGIAWSTAGVLAATLERAAGLGLTVELLAPGADVDTAADLARLAARLAADHHLAPRTRELLAAWGRLPVAS